MRFVNSILLVGTSAALLFGVVAYFYRQHGHTVFSGPAMAITHVSTSAAAPRATSQVGGYAPVVNTERSVNWDKDARGSKDHFGFIRSASKAALNGDGRAAYYVSQMLMPCLLVTHSYGNETNPEEAFNAALSADMPGEMIERKRREFHNCSGFLKGNDVFADLPQRQGGYKSYKFWLDLAYENNDPLAQTVHAALAIGSAVSPNPGSMQIAQTDINNAIASRDPEAIFRAGFIISNGLYVDRIQGYAFSLAACDLGYDCSAKNAELIFGQCVPMNTCPEGSVFSDWVIKNLGSEGYAQAYARAQQIESALAQNDYHTLLQFAQLKSEPRSTRD